jgi:hypothetical protein
MKMIGDTKLYQWEDIGEEFRGADIFLGNGFSINVYPALNYSSLFNKLLSYLTVDERSVLNNFNSTNFEDIQGKLLSALRVNSSFGYQTPKIESTIKVLKRGLLLAVKDLHPASSDLDPVQVFRLSQRLDWFQDIFTTNYDILLYHISLITLDRFKTSRCVPRCQDFFRLTQGRLEFFVASLVHYRNIYYLHGALFIYKEKDVTVKMRRGGITKDLLNLVGAKVLHGDVPLFVSEGSSSLKRETIKNSEYLRFCGNAFRTAQKPLVIHGFSFSDCDDHLIADLNNCKRNLAIGLYLNGLGENQVSQKIKAILYKLFKYSSTEIKFYDSKSLF